MLDRDLIALVDRLAQRLRRAHRISRTVTLRLRFDDFSRATRSHTLPEATADTIALLTAGRVLLGDAMPMIERRGITLIGIAFTNLFGDDAVQMALPFGAASSTAIDMTLDDVRERFGAKSVTRGVLLGRREGLQVPLLPD
jgi:DNA polymerase-4